MERLPTPPGCRFKAMDMDERWVNRTPETMLESFHRFQGELCGLIVEDLLRLPPEPGVIAEGFRLLPRLVKSLAEPGHAVWLLPTPEFSRAAFASQGSLSELAGKTGDPERALGNLLERDRIFNKQAGCMVRRTTTPAQQLTRTRAWSRFRQRYRAPARVRNDRQR